MRIALNILASGGSLSGMARYARNLIPSLAKVDERNEYVLYVSRDEALRYSGLGANFQLAPTVASRPLRIMWEQTGLPADLKQRRIDVFHGLSFVTPLVKTCRQVVTVHDMTFFLFPQYHGFIKRHYFRSLIPRCVRRADQVIADSESTKADIVRILGAEAEKIKVAYLGTDERFRPGKDAATSSRLRANYGLSRKVILFVGLIEPRKNLETLIRAYAMLAGAARDSCLVLAGPLGWGYQAVFQAVSECGVKDRVIFPGFVPEEELPGLYNLADVFVYPSLYEGFGLPVLEAMACGVPVITSNVSSMPEIAGGAALLVEPSDARGLACAIGRVLADQELRQRMSREGIERSSPFTWERTARETLAAYEAAAGQRTSGSKVD